MPEGMGYARSVKQYPNKKGAMKGKMDMPGFEEDTMTMQGGKPAMKPDAGKSGMKGRKSMKDKMVKQY